MLRIPVKQRYVLRATFTVGGIPTDLDALPTVSVYRASGVVLVSGTATDDPGAGNYSFVLTPTHTADTEVLRVEWIGSRDGVPGQLVAIDELHVIGRHYHTLAELRAMDGLSNVTNYPDATLVLVRDLAAFALEDACGVAFVPRYSREARQGTGSRLLVAAWPKPRAIRELSEDGQAVAASDYPVLRPTGGLRRTWATWDADLTYVIGYEHGYADPPPRLVNAAKKLARHYAIEDVSTYPERATAVDSEHGSFRLVTAGIGAMAFDIPEVNAAVQEYRI